MGNWLSKSENALTVKETKQSKKLVGLSLYYDRLGVGLKPNPFRSCFRLTIQKWPMPPWHFHPSSNADPMENRVWYPGAQP